MRSYSSRELCLHIDCKQKMVRWPPGLDRWADGGAESGTFGHSCGCHIRAYTGGKAETKEEKRNTSCLAAAEVCTRRINWVSLDRTTRVIRADAGYGWADGRTF
jgi:hypothetical protein